MTRRPPRSPLFPYTTLFRSSATRRARRATFSTRSTRRRRSGTASRSRDRKSTRLNSTHRYISYPLFFFNDTAPTEISPLSLHDALPIFGNPTRTQGYFFDAFHEKKAFWHCITISRSEEHTSELHSPLHLLSPLFF